MQNTKTPYNCMVRRMEQFSICCGDSYTTVCICETHSTVTLKRVNFTVYKMDLNKMKMYSLKISLMCGECEEEGRVEEGSTSGG